jgi:uncharacterized protein (DUF58 family)
MKLCHNEGVAFSFLPSIRFAVYCALGVLFWAGAAVSPAFFVAALLYNLALLVVALLDITLSPQPGEFEIARDAPEKMNLGVANSVRLIVRMQSTRVLRAPLSITLRDEPPSDWPVENEEIPAPPNSPPVARATVQVLPLRQSGGEYSVTPTRRGDFEFGRLSARYPTLLGFWHRQFSREARQQVRVYPDTTAVRRYELRLRQGRLRDIGLHLLRLRGRGTEFESLREYSRDDEYKAINWKASARHGKLISTDYEIERDQTVLIAIDCGRMMTALAVAREIGGQRLEAGVATTPVSSLQSPVPLSKLDCAINATVLLAHVAASMGDAVGLLLFSDTILKFIAPRKGKVQTGAIIEALYAAQPTLVEPDYQAAYEYLIGRKVRRALVVTFTDLIDAEASRELLMASTALRKHHNPLCVTINNRDVIEMAGVLPARAEELYEKAMAMKMLHSRAQALEELRQRGVGILDVEARELTVATVNRYLDLKARMAL